MDPEHRRALEIRMDEVCRALGLTGSADSKRGTAEQRLELVEIEDLYAEREHLLQELEKDC